MKHPTHCPYCGSAEHLRICPEWNAVSADPVDADNTTTLTEWQCMSDACEGRSFWTDTPSQEAAS